MWYALPHFYLFPSLSHDFLFLISLFLEGKRKDLSCYDSSKTPWKKNPDVYKGQDLLHHGRRACWVRDERRDSHPSSFQSDHRTY